MALEVRSPVREPLTVNVAVERVVLLTDCGKETVYKRVCDSDIDCFVEPLTVGVNVIVDASVGVADVLLVDELRDGVAEDEEDVDQDGVLL